MELAEFITVPQVEKVVLTRPLSHPMEGTLCVTAHHLILARRGEITEEFVVLHRNIDFVEQKPSSPKTLTLYCKNFQVIELSFPTSEYCAAVAFSAEKLSRIVDVTLCYPFFFASKSEVLEDGWLAFTAESEYAKFQNSTEWRVSNVNQDFKYCKSYPETVVVPKSITDEILIKSAAFRQNGRFPVLSYFHKRSGTSLARCSQPLVGTANRRSKEDEFLVNGFVISGKKAYIVDIRKATLSKQDQQKGGGYESEAFYSQWKRSHLAVAQWKMLQNSLCTMMEACKTTDLPTDKYLSKLNSSHWLDFVRDVLICSCVVSQYMDKEEGSVLVHGSTGTDATLQVTSVSQLILSPDCRTIRGFEALIEREWLQAGHPFGLRCSNSAFSQSADKTEAPVFLLFLDCVYQIWQQYPCSFEFNENFLITLFENAYSSKYGTFLCNSALERKALGLSRKTVSLWSYLNHPEVLKNFLNPLYEPNNAVIWPSVAPQSMNLWQGLYLRYQTDPSAQIDMWESIKIIKARNSELQTKTNRCAEQRIASRRALAFGLPQPQRELRSRITR